MFISPEQFRKCVDDNMKQVNDNPSILNYHMATCIGMYNIISKNPHLVNVLVEKNFHEYIFQTMNNNLNSARYQRVACRFLAIFCRLTLLQFAASAVKVTTNAMKTHVLDKEVQTQGSRVLIIFKTEYDLVKLALMNDPMNEELRQYVSAYESGQKRPGFHDEDLMNKRNRFS
jgi:hypothetical protein